MFRKLVLCVAVASAGCTSSPAPSESPDATDETDPGDVTYADDPVTTRVDDGVEVPDTSTDGSDADSAETSTDATTAEAGDSTVGDGG